MTQPLTNEPETGANSRRARGPARAFPVMKFEAALSLPESILENGVNGEIARLLLFTKLGKSPSSGPSKNWVRTSAKYGLTEGSNSSSFLSVTSDARVALGDERDRDTVEKRFQLAIRQFEPFDALYSKLKGQRLQDAAVLGGELGRLGVSDNDQRTAAEVFTANLHFLGLITETAGGEHVRTIEEVIKQTPENASGEIGEPNHTSAQSDAGPASVAEPLATSASSQASINGPANGPALHLDIQVHIDASASPDQIEQIFASMARHLYGRE